MGFAKAVVLGFLIAAPVGPIGLLCIGRGLAGGWLAGFVSGLGAATADGIYAGAAMFGLIAVTTAIAPLQLPLRIAGALFLAYLGVKTLRDSNAAATAASGASGGLLRLYASTFALTIVNPMTIASFVAIFAAAGLSGYAPLVVIAGVFAGSAAWWLALGAGVGALRERLPANFVRWTHLVSGGGLLAFAAAALVVR